MAKTKAKAKGGTYILDDIADLAVEIDSVRPFPGNARDGDIGQLTVSLAENGQYRPIVVNIREGTQYGDMAILAGNHTWQAARVLGWDRIAATFVNVDDMHAKRINVVDNRSNDLATYDDQALADILTGIIAEVGPIGLDGTGFDTDDLDDIIRMIDGPPDLDDLADNYDDDGDPDANYAVLKLKVPPHVQSAWNIHRAEHASDGDALEELLP